MLNACCVLCMMRGGGVHIECGVNGVLCMACRVVYVLCDTLVI